MESNWSSGGGKRVIILSHRGKHLSLIRVDWVFIMPVAFDLAYKYNFPPNTLLFILCLLRFPFSFLLVPHSLATIKVKAQLTSNF